MPNKKHKALSVLIVSRLAFTVCFAIWMMFAVIGIPITKTLNLNETEFGILTATPVLTGSLMHRVVWVSLIWMYWTEVREAEVMGPRATAFKLKG